MAQWKATKTMIKTVTNDFSGGLNSETDPFNLKDNELTYMRNLAIRRFTDLQTRGGRYYTSTDYLYPSLPQLQGFTALKGSGYSTNFAFTYVSGTTWVHYDDYTHIKTIYSTKITGAVIFIDEVRLGSTSHLMLVTSTDKKYTGFPLGGSANTTEITDTNCPNIGCFITYKGRVFTGQKTSFTNNRFAKVIFSALNSITDWTSATPIETAAGSLMITDTIGDVTGFVEFNGKLIIFTLDTMHELYGSGPENFELIRVEGAVGCVNIYSIVKTDKKLYWFSIDGFYEYDGSGVKKISRKIDDYVKKMRYTSNIVATVNKNKIYFAVAYNNEPGNTSNNLILVYDTNNDTWNTETGSIYRFFKSDSNLYAVDSTGVVLSIDDTTIFTDNSTAISYEFITKPYVYGSGQTQQTLWDMSLLYKGESGATLEVSYSTASTDNNSTSFNTIAVTSDFTFDGKDHTKRIIISPTQIQNESFYRLRCSGTGFVTFHRLERNYRVKRR